MTDAFPQEVSWMVKAGTAETVALLATASRKYGFRFTSSGYDVSVEIPKSFRKRRSAARLSGTMTPTEGGTDIRWGRGPEWQREFAHLSDLEAAVPMGKIHYYGLIEVSATAGLVFDERRIFRTVAGHFDSDEWVLAVGRGRSGEQTCIIVLTDRRLLLVAYSLNPPPLLNAPLVDIAAVTLGKRSTGETLRVGLSPNDLFVSHLGHAEGYAIASTFRLRKQELARTRPISAPQVRTQ